MRYPGFTVSKTGYEKSMSERDPAEVAEEDLVEQAEHGDGGPSPTRAAFPPEAESDAGTAEDGEADEERTPDGPGED